MCMNLKSEMIFVLFVRILSQSIWNFCMKKGGTLDLMLSIDHPTAKQNHLKTCFKTFLITTKTISSQKILAAIQI